MRASSFSALSVCLAATLSAAQQPGTPRPRALTHAHVIDVHTGSIARDVTLTVRNGRIASIGPEPAPQRYETFDVAGAYVLPGLIDAHTHLSTLDGARRALLSGVTTVRMASVSFFTDLAMRDLVASGAIAGPDVVASGLFVRHAPPPDALLTAPSLADLKADGDRAANLVRVVRVNLERGVGVIKIASTERAGLPDTDPREQTYTEAELRAVVDEAATAGVPVEARAHGDEGAMAAVRAGVRSIEHGTYLSDATLTLMRENGVFLVPTYSILTDLLQSGGDYDDPVLVNRSRHMTPRLRTTIEHAHRIGVRIVTGSDTAYGPNSLARISHEVAHLAEMGLTPLEALQAATVTAADLLLLDGQTGALEPGLEADVLVVEGNPLENPLVLQDPLLILSNGRVALTRMPPRP